MQLQLPPLCLCSSATHFSVDFESLHAKNCPLAGRSDLYEQLLTSMLKTYGVL